MVTPGRVLLTCFVASAFGRDDVDAIYDEAVVPVLADLKIRPVRIDRLEHNDDIDDRILATIDRCDLCLADLTYARPSVYFEAGRVSGLGKPTVYIARSDHFRNKPDDNAGNLQVHFDLQMKNIIAWTRPNATFRKRLASRIRYVTRPILADRHSMEASRQAEKAFAARSPRDRIAALTASAQKVLSAEGYKSLSRPYFPSIIAFRSAPDGTDVAVVYVGQSFAKRDLAPLLGDGAFFRVMKDIRGVFDDSLAPVHSYDVLCVSLRRLPSSRVLDVCSSFRTVRPAAIYRDTSPSRWATSLHTLCPKSEPEFRAMMLQHCQELGEPRAAPESIAKRNGGR